MALSFGCVVALAPAAAAAGQAGPAQGAEPFDGDYESPLGRIRIEAGEGGVKGTVVAPSALCPFLPGEQVFRGTLLDDSLAGQLRVCLRGKACSAREEWASAVLLVAPSRLSGAVHVSARRCLGPLGKRGGITMARSGAAPIAAAPTPAAARTAAATLPAAADPGRARALLRDGAGHLGEGNFEQARRRFLEAIAADPSVTEAYNGVGVTFRMRNDLGEALAWYKKALAVDPDFGDAYYNMACVYALQGKVPMALRYLQIAYLNGYVTAEGIEQDPDLAYLRGTPEYRSLVRARM